MFCTASGYCPVLVGCGSIGCSGTRRRGRPKFHQPSRCIHQDGMTIPSPSEDRLTFQPDRNSTHSLTRSSTFTERSLNIHSWKEPVPTAFQFTTFTHTMDGWHSIGDVRACHVARSLHWIFDCRERKIFEQHQNHHGQNQVQARRLGAG